MTRKSFILLCVLDLLLLLQISAPLETAQLSKLGRNISPTDMYHIALEQLQFEIEEWNNLKENHHSPTELHVMVLLHWKRKDHGNNRHVSIFLEKL